MRHFEYLNILFSVNPFFKHLPIVGDPFEFELLQKKLIPSLDFHWTYRPTIEHIVRLGIYFVENIDGIWINTMSIFVWAWAYKFLCKTYLQCIQFAFVSKQCEYVWWN